MKKIDEVVIAMMSEKIKLVLVKRNKTGQNLAEALDCTPQNIYRLLQKDNWNEDQLRKVAEELNCKLVLHLELNDTGECF